MKTKPFKTIQTVVLSPRETIARLEQRDMCVSNYAKDLIAKVPLYTPEQVDLVLLKITELGFTEYPTWSQVLAKAQELGYDLCQPQDGPALRLAWNNQSKDTWAYIGMEPITDSDDYPDVFCVDRCGHGKYWLDAYWVYPDYEWNLDRKVVFRLRKNSKPLDTEHFNTQSLDTWPLDELEINGIAYKRK